MKTKIYGASDDLIEIEGEVNDEIGCFNDSEKGIKIECSDGTKGTISYDGEWKIQLSVFGANFTKIVTSVGDDNKHSDLDTIGCTSYSDVLVLSESIEWVKIGKKTYKK